MNRNQYTGNGAPRPNGNGGRRLSPEEIRKRQAEARKKAAKARADAEKAALRDRRKQALRLEKEKRKQEKKRRAAMERMKRHDDRFELTEEEKQIRARMKREEQLYRAKQRKTKRRIFFGRFLVFLVMFVVLLGASLGVFYFRIVGFHTSSGRAYTYVVGTDTKITVPYDNMVRGGTLYCNISPVVSMLNMATIGDTTERLFFTKDESETVQFLVGSTQVFVNGVETRMTASPYLIGEDLYVPYSFFETYTNGLTLSNEKNVVTIKQAVDESTKETLPFSFVLRSDAPMLMLDEYNEFGNSSPIEFKADLDVYEEFMNPTDRDAYLILVNQEYPLDAGYVPDTVEITDIRYDGRPLQYLVNAAEKAAHAMILEMKTEGFEDISILLGYRSYSKQKNQYQSKVEDYMKSMSEEAAQAAAATVTAPAGCNPQQAGTSMILHDILDEDSATDTFAKTATYTWLVENCWKFGFILRYPADKTQETGMVYQPCFFTYVGRYHAQRIMEKGISLEEYIASLEERNYFDGRTYAEFRKDLIGR